MFTAQLDCGLTLVSQDTDRNLFSRIAKGDVAAYTAIYYKYTSTLYAFAIKLLKSDVWAEEIVHEIFLQLWLRRDVADKIDNPSAYLYRATANGTIDWMRKHSLELKVVYYAKLHGATHVNSTEQMVDLRSSETLINEAIDQLTPQRKLIFKMKNEQGLSYEQIAERLVISKHTVRNQLVKSIEAIRRYLLQKGEITLIQILLMLWWV